MSQEVRLCEHLMTAYHGHDAGQIASILLSRGRLDFGTLVRLSGLAPKTVRVCLLVLIQHGCVYHSVTTPIPAVPIPSTSTSDPPPTQPTFYSANPREMLARTRFGKYSAMAESLFSEEGGAVVEMVLRVGRVGVGELVELMVSDGKSTEGQGKKAVDKKSKAVKAIISKMLGERFLAPSHPHSTINPTDRHMAWEQEMLAEIKGVATPKDIRAIKERLEDKIRLEEEQEFDELLAFGSSAKRQVVGSGVERPSKKRAVEESAPVEDSLIIRVNYARFDIKIRNRILEQACKIRFNKEAAMVLRAMLSCAEAGQKDCSQLHSAPVSVQAILQKLPADTAKDILRRCFPSTAADGQFNLSLLNSGDLASEILSCLSNADDLATASHTTYVSNPPLRKALAEVNPSPFVSEVKFGAGGRGGVRTGSLREFRVEYGRMAVELRKKIVDRVVKEKLGVEAARICKILMCKGKLDEKHLAKHAMLTSKDARELCLRLLSSSLIELQEVPRTADRMPSRTFYLFYISFPKLCSALLSDLYKSQSNLLARKSSEMREKQSLLEKLERSDVREDREGLLGVFEKREVAVLEAKIEALEVALGRIEGDVFVLRDMPWLEEDA